jgi:hypothetical protein
MCVHTVFFYFIQGLTKEGVNPIGSDSHAAFKLYAVFRAGLDGVLGGESGAGLLVSLWDPRRQ